MQMTRRVVPVLGAVAVLAASSGIARAQVRGFDGERLAPAAGAAGGVFVERPVVPFHLGHGFGLFLHFADDPVVVRQGSTMVGTPLDGSVSTDLFASIGLFDRLELALHLPLRLYYEGDATAAPLIAAAGVGDLRFVPKVAIARGGDAAFGWAFGAALPVTFPTGDDLALRGSSGLTVEPRLLFGVYPGRLAIVANAGLRVRRNGSYSPGSELTFGLAGTYTLPALRERLDLHAEVAGGWLPQVDGRALVALPLEAVGGVIIRPHPRWSVYGIGGVGITNGLAVPDFRALAGVRYAFDVPGRGGQRDADGDGVADGADKCASEAEDRDGFEDADGCPEPDNDRDGVPDDDDECPDFAEEPGGDRDGCPDKARVIVRNGEMIDLRQGAVRARLRRHPAEERAAGGRDGAGAQGASGVQAGGDPGAHRRQRRGLLQPEAGSAARGERQARAGQARRAPAADRAQGLRRGEPPRAERHARRPGQEPAGRVRDPGSRLRRFVMRRSVAALVLVLAPLCASAAFAQTFPSTFAPLYCPRGFMVDAYRDQSGAVDERDIVGTVDRPAGYRAVDGQYLYLRLRVDGTPVQGNRLTSFAWGFEFSTDGDPTDYEVLIAVDGAAETVVVYSNTTTTVPDSPADPADQLVMTYPFAQNGRVVDAGLAISGGGNDTFLDMAVPWSDLTPLGLDATTLVTIWAASSTNPDRLNGDFACHDARGSTTVPRLSEATSAPVAADPARSPAPIGGPSGAGSADAGNLIGTAGLEGGPGCNCHVAPGDPPVTLTLALLALGWLASRFRRHVRR